MTTTSIIKAHDYEAGPKHHQTGERMCARCLAPAMHPAHLRTFNGTGERCLTCDQIMANHDQRFDLAGAPFLCLS